ncbi:MAG: hypothetical protein OXQ29_05055 [Rhodospirillaceae bacterium]|nr:hypothetical protein [Rhodospirillaceae bacterium]
MTKGDAKDQRELETAQQDRLAAWEEVERVLAGRDLKALVGALTRFHVTDMAFTGTALRVHGRNIDRIRRALDAAGIDLPSE